MENPDASGLTRSGPIYNVEPGADVVLLNGTDGSFSEEPSSLTVNATVARRIGARASFSVRTGYLQAGNTIAIAYIHRTTDKSGGKARLTTQGWVTTLKTAGGQEIGSVGFDLAAKDGNADCEGALVLRVTHTVPGSGLTSLSFGYQWMMTTNYGTSAGIMRLMPFTNTFEVHRAGGGGGLMHSYAIHFNGMSPTHAATQVGNDVYWNNLYVNRFQANHYRVHDRVSTDAQFAALQASGGASGAPSDVPDIHADYHISSSNQEIVPDSTMEVELAVWYVSAATHKVQAALGSNTPAGTEASRSRATVPVHNAGAGIAVSALRRLANADGSSCAYCSRQDDGSWLVAYTIKQDFTKLTDQQIETQTRNNSFAAAAPNASDADVQATLDFYHGVLANHATGVTLIASFALSDPYTQTRITQQEVDDNGNVIHAGGSGLTSPVVVTASGETSVAVHRLRLDGQTLGDAVRSAGRPTGMVDAAGAVHDGAYALPRGADADVPGYTLLGGAGPCTAVGGGCVDVSSLDAGQRDTLLATASRLGLKEASGMPVTSVAGLESLASHDPVGNRPGSGGPQVWYAGNTSSVYYPGESDVWYDSSGRQTTANAPGATEGWGNTDVYCLYVGNPETIRVHWVDMGADQSQDPDASGGVEDASRLRVFTGRSGDALHVGDLSGTVPAGMHVSAASPGVTCTGGAGGTGGAGARCGLDAVYDASNAASGADPTPQDVWIHYADDVHTVTGTRTVSRTVRYERSGDGSTAGMPAPHTDSLSFDLDTETFSNAWNPRPVTVGAAWRARGGTVLPAVEVPEVAGYLPDRRGVPALTGLGQSDAGRDYDVTVVYSRATGLLPFTGASGLALLGASVLSAVVFLVLAVVLSSRRRV